MHFYVPVQDDYARLADIYNRASKPFHGILSDSEKAYFTFTETADTIAEQCQSRELLAVCIDNVIVGYAFFRLKNSDCLWISSLYIDPVFQQQGFGMKLLQHIENYGQKNGIKIIALETHPKAEWAINFYIKQGYVDVINDLANHPYSTVLDKPPVKGRHLLGKVL